MNEQLRASIDIVRRRETELDLEERYVPEDARHYLIGYPKVTHNQYGKIFCYLWFEIKDNFLSDWQSCGAPPWFLNKKFIPEDDYSEEAIDAAIDFIQT